MPDCAGGEFLGRKTTIGISIGCSDTVPASFDIIGTARGLSLNGTRGTVEVTSRKSGNVREYINDYLDGTVSFDGTIVRDGTDQARAILDYFFDSTVETAHVWFQFTMPGEGTDTVTIEVPAVLTTYNAEFPYDAVSTFTGEANFNGAPVITDIPGA